MLAQAAARSQPPPPPPVQNPSNLRNNTTAAANRPNGCNGWCRCPAGLIEKYHGHGFCLVLDCCRGRLPDGEVCRGLQKPCLKLGCRDRHCDLLSTCNALALDRTCWRRSEGWSCRPSREGCPVAESHYRPVESRVGQSDRLIFHRKAGSFTPICSTR